MAAHFSSKPPHLEPSNLGTKEYWDNQYASELSNHAQDPSNVGTIWFDDSAAEDKVLSFLRNPKLGLDRETCSFLDVGTGNGHILFKLREGSEEENEEDEEGKGEDQEEEGRHEAGGMETTERAATKTWGFKGRMLGEDYSRKSIEFARRLGGSRGLGPGTRGFVEFQQRDVMREPPRPRPEILTTGAQGEHDSWDVVLDKGTFDAISLSDERDRQGRRACEAYKARIEPLVSLGGLFLVTSCNWTERELRAWFEGGCFEWRGAIKYRSFSFGGEKGQTISSVCFKKVGF